MRYYDIGEINPSKRSKSINTKIPISEPDRKRVKEGKKIQGTKEIRDLVKQFRTQLAKKKIEFSTGIKLSKNNVLSFAFTEYLADRNIIGTNKFIRPKTTLIYKKAVEFFIKTANDKIIAEYTERDYTKLLVYFTQLNLKQNSKSIYSRALHTLWNYFVKQNYAPHNIIETLRSEQKEPSPIPLSDMREILTYLKNSAHPYQYHLIMFMYLTGCRPSSAMVQLKEDVDYSNNEIYIKNVKTSGRLLTNKTHYVFPLYQQLVNLLSIEMKLGTEGKGRMFPEFSFSELSYTQNLKFWLRTNKVLFKNKKIKAIYSLKQIRSTSAYYFINELNLDIYTVQKLLDHSSVRITEKHYASLNIAKTRNKIDRETITEL